MKFFDRMEEILGHRPATRPDVVLDSSCSSPTNTSTTSSSALDVSSMDPEEGSPGGPLKVSDEDEPTNDEAEKQTDGKGESSKDVKPSRKKVKRKRPGRDEMFEKTMDSVVSKVAKMQEMSDARFLDLEEKRLLLDERMVEMEQARWRETRDREEAQRREEREFQLKVYYDLITFDQHIDYYNYTDASAYNNDSDVACCDYRCCRCCLASLHSQQLLPNSLFTVDQHHPTCTIGLTNVSDFMQDV